MASETLHLFQEPLLTLILAVGLYGALTFTGMSFSAVLVLAFVFYRIMTHVNTLQMRYQIMSVGESAFCSIREASQRAEEEREQVEGGRTPEPVTEGIRFDSVSFGYDDEPLFSDLSFAIPAGSFVTLIGPSGAGKTTIVDLICGLHRPTSREIYLDQTPMSEIDLGQRISIARALVANPTLLILDEVTTALDPATEQEICETLLDLRGRVTIVAISHQPALHEAADLTLDLQQGRVFGGTGVTSPAPASS